jgi:DNA invertase Pin-like site-specific DNA recombinase
MMMMMMMMINEMHGSRSKIPSKKSRQAALRRGIYFRL